LEPSLSSRAVARNVLEQVETERAYANRALSAALDRARALPAEERALATELVYGVLRRQSRIDRALEAISDRGLGGIDLRVRIALRVAAYQILFLDRIPAYAAVNEAVEACKKARGPRMAGLANALLRKLVDRREPALPDAAADPLGYLVDVDGMSEWLARLALGELPLHEALAFGDTICAVPPLSLRANRLRIDRAALAARLAEERPAAEITESPFAPDALLVRRIDSPFTTAAFAQGLFAVEDVGAQIVAELCGAAPGETILDACAGLGGKTAHLAALAQNGAAIEAADVAPAKLRQTAELAARLGARGVTTLVSDLTRPQPGPARYHRILLDAPCAGLGVLRRHPEALFRRAAADLPGLAQQQAQMLDALAPLVLPGGSLTYSVCTFDRAECESVVEVFLRAHGNFRVEAPSAGVASPADVSGLSTPAPRVPWAALTDAAGYVRTWPQHHDADAFFAVRLRAAGGVAGVG
jgi:16S rRNA (cytosine967-C5)-methyltransferase